MKNGCSGALVALWIAFTIPSVYKCVEYLPSDQATSTAIWVHRNTAASFVANAASHHHVRVCVVERCQVAVQVDALATGSAATTLVCEIILVGVVVAEIVIKSAVCGLSKRM